MTKELPPAPPPKKPKVGRKRKALKKQVGSVRKSVKKSTKVLERELANKELKTKQLNAVSKGTSTLVDADIAEKFKDKNVVFEPNAGPQTDFLAAAEDEVFYGGARGGGKSYAMLVDPLRYCHFRAHRAVIIRRTMPELRELIRHSQFLYPKAFPGAKWREQEKHWVFPSGAIIEFGYAETEADLLRYQGQSYTWIGIDELPQFPNPNAWHDLRASLRSVDPHNVPAVMRATGNPGNIGSMWVKEMFIDPAPPNTPFKCKVPTSVGEKHITRRFIPARVTDNPHLMQTDSYLIGLSSLPEIRRKQFLDGDWDAFENSAFPEFNRKIHVIKPFNIPREYVRFRAADWGYSSPACCLWMAIDHDNNIIVYDELYTKGKTADVFADIVKYMEKDHRIAYGILDSSVWAQRGDSGPSIPETMRKRGVSWRKSDRSKGSRIAGKAEVHRRLATYHNGEEEVPRLVIFDTCINLIRTLPMLRLDSNNYEDVDTKMEDHAYDALRYGCMSRPLGRAALLGFESLTASLADQNRPADPIFGY